MSGHYLFIYIIHTSRRRYMQYHLGLHLSTFFIKQFNHFLPIYNVTCFKTIVEGSFCSAISSSSECDLSIQQTHQSLPGSERGGSGWVADNDERSDVRTDCGSCDRHVGVPSRLRGRHRQFLHVPFDPLSHAANARFVWSLDVQRKVTISSQILLSALVFVIQSFASIHF